MEPQWDGQTRRSAPTFSRITAQGRHAGLPLRFRSEAEHDVEARRQFTDARFFDRREIDDDGFADFGIANALEDRVALVARVPLDVALGGELLQPFHFNGEMNMRRATGIGNRFDGAEQVFAIRPGHETSETLEVHVAFILVDSSGMKVSAVVVALPDFYESAADRLAATVENAPGQIGDRAHCGRDR